MAKKDIYQEKLEARLKEVRAQLDKFDAEAQKAEADAKARLEKEKENLRKRQEEAERKLQELRKSGEDAWEDMRAGTEAALRNLNDALSKAFSRFGNR